MPNDFLGLVPLMVLPKGWKLNWRASNKWGLTDTKPFVNTCQDSIWILDLNLDHLAIWRWKICAIFCRDIWRSIIEIKKEREREREIRKLIIKWGKTRVKEFNLQIRESRSLINVRKINLRADIDSANFCFFNSAKKSNLMRFNMIEYQRANAHLLSYNCDHTSLLLPYKYDLFRVVFAICLIKYW